MTIDAKLFAHIENDSSLKGTFKLEGNRFTHTVAYLNDYLQLLSHNKQSFPPEYATLLQQLQYLVATEEKMESLLQAVQPDQTVKQLAQTIAEDVIKMPPDSKLLIPGGWNNSDGGHAMVYEFTPQGDGFTFSAINAGAGINYHAKKSRTDKELYNPQKSWHIPKPSSPKSKEELVHFIERLLKARLPSSLQKKNKPITQKVLYEETLPSISYINGVEIDANKGMPQHAFTGGQLSGTCSQRCIHQMIKILTPSEKKYQEFIFDFKQHALYEYSNACLNRREPYTPAVAAQIRLAIENNLKILNTPGLFEEERIEKELEKISALEESLKITPFDAPQQKIDAAQEQFSLNMLTVQSATPPIRLDPQEYDLALPAKIDLGDGAKLLTNLDAAIKNLRLINNPAAKYNYLEHLLLQLPLNPVLSRNQGFYRELANQGDIDLLKKHLNDIQAILLSVQNSLFNKQQSPAINMLLLSLISLQMDVHTTHSSNNKLPSFTPLSNAIMQTMVGNQERNPFYATNNPLLDQRFKVLQSRYNGSQRLYLEDYHRFLEQLVKSEPELNEELIALYDKEFSQDTTELHQELRKANLKSLFLISRHYDNKSMHSSTNNLDAKFDPIIQKVISHIEHESMLRKAINPFFEVQYKDTVWFRLSINKSEFRVDSPLFPSYVPHQELLAVLPQSKYPLNDSPAKTALIADISTKSSFQPQSKITSKSANSIQLTPAQSTDDAKTTRNVTQADIVARDYLHLRSEPTLQIALTLDYFKRNIEKLSQESNQRYLEANLFQPGLLLKALSTPEFMPQFDAFLKTGIKFFTQNGQHQRDSLLFLRLDFLVSHYMFLNKDPEGLVRLKNIQNDLEKQLSLPNKPETTYVLQQYLFLNLVARLERGEKSEELFTLAYQAYNYINSHTNPLILEDKIHRMQVDCALVNFKSIIRDQPERTLIQIVKKTVLAIENESEQDINVTGHAPVFTVENKRTSAQYQFNVLKGKMYERGLARSGIPLVIQNHPLIKELGLDQIKECLMTANEAYMLIPDEQQEVRIFSQNTKLTVQKHWTIEGKKQNYELLALTQNHEAQHANATIRKLTANLPPILKDGTMNYWVSVSDPDSGLLVQNNIPVFAVKSGKIMALNEKGIETGEQLSAQSEPLLSSLESNKFQLTYKNAIPTDSVIKLPRYNLGFENRQGTLYHQETGEQVIDSPSPIHPYVAGIVLASKEQQHYMVPVARFYATEENAQTSDFYPVAHDISGTIAEARLTDHWKSHPTMKKPLWHYPNSERHVMFQLKDGEPIADSVSDALYLAYIYMATNQTEKAWSTLEECTTRFGGLTGDPDELKFISWICNDMPHILPSEKSEQEKNKPKRDTPPYVACQLKATSLLCDHIAQNGPIGLKNTKSLDGTANAVYDSLQKEALEQFQKALPNTIYQSFTRLQTMGRHLEHTYTLSSLERKRLLSYYHQSQPVNHAPKGALGYEWLNLSLETLLEEQESLLARQTADESLSTADNERLKLIQKNLNKLKPVVAKSSILEKVPVDLSLPDTNDSIIKKGHLKPETIAEMDTWMHQLPGVQLLTQEQAQSALHHLSSIMSDDDFIMNFPQYLRIATSSNVQQRKELYDFCSHTLIATRHIPLKDQESNIPLLCNVLYRLLTPGNEEIFRYNNYKFNDLVLRFGSRRVDPLFIYQAKDVYQEILATPEQIMAQRERPEHKPLTATNKVLPSLLAQTKIEKHLPVDANQELQLLIARYKQLEEESDQALNELAKTIDQDLDKTFSIEEQAGKIRFSMEQEKRELAHNLIQNNTIISALTAATEQAEPLLKLKIEKTWQEALALANQGPEEPEKARKWTLEKKSKVRPTLTQTDLLALYSQADSAYSVQKTGLSLENAQRLHNAIHKALIHGIQYQSLEKITKDLAKASSTGDANTAAQALDVLARTEIPGLDEPSVVILQHEEKVLLRKRQSSALHSLLKVPEDGRRFNETIEKIIMGGGKSKVILPILAEKKAQGDNLVVVEVPQALLATNHVDLNSTSQRLFGKRAYRFDFDRDSDCSPQRLEQIYNLFIEIMSTRSYLVTTGEAVQSLELKYLELLLSEEKPTAEWKQQVYWCDKITNLFRHHTDCIIDEVHLGLSLKKKLNYTFGVPKQISPSLIKNATALFGFVDLDVIKNAPSFDEHFDWTSFKTDLATKLINDPNSPLKTFITHAVVRFGKGVQEELLAYLTNRATVMPESVLDGDDEIKAALGFFKQEINVRLPQTLTQMLGKHYGPSKRKDLSAIEKTVAIPYAGTNVPNERNRYQDELEAINKTIQMMLLQGISKEQLIERIAEWEALAREELFNLPAPTDELAQKPTIDDTPTAKGFALVTQGLGLSLSQIDSKNSDQMNELHQRLQSNLPLIFDILREFSLKQIMQDSGILSSDNFNHAAQYRSVQGISGTPPLNDNAYHQRLNYDKAPSLGSDGYIFEVIRNKKTAVSSCDNEETYQFIHDVISKSKNREHTRAFIDIRGAFTGVNNYRVAQQTARYIKDYPQHFSNPMKQVLYFNEDQILCAIDVNHPDKPIELGTSDINELNRLLDTTPEERFTLFDQIHTTGTDIKQFNKAHAIVFVDDKTNMQEFLQGAMRERELYLNQTIELIVPTRMHGITLDKLGNQFKKNDKQSVTADAPAAAQGQMRNHIRRQFLNLIQDLPSEDAEKKAALTQHFRPLFEDKPSLNLFALYGGINKKQAIAGILGHYKNQMQKLWESQLKSASIPAFAEEIEQMSLELEKIIEKSIPFCLAEYDVSDKSFNAEVEVQKEVQKEVQIEVLTLNETYKPELQPENARSWSYSTNYNKLFDDYYQLNYYSLSLNELCKKDKDEESPQLFSKNLYGSRNYAQTHSGQQHYTGAFLKPVFLVWYHRYQGTLSAMIVTPQEAIELGARIQGIQDSWIATTQDTVIAGKPPKNIITEPKYQELREQVRFFNGEFSSLSNQDTPLLWLNALPVQKLDFYEQNLLPCRPGSEAKLHQLKTTLTQAKSEGFAYIAKHPFEDLSHFNWEELYTDILPTQAMEYQKLAEAFVYSNQNWDSKDLNVMELQQRFNLPMNSLTYVDVHLNNLQLIKQIVTEFKPHIDKSTMELKTPKGSLLFYLKYTSPQKRIILESCLGMTIEHFYKSRQCEPLQDADELNNPVRDKEIYIHSLELLHLLNTSPALKDKNLFSGYLIGLAQNAKSKEELTALMNTLNPEETLLATIIKNRVFEDSLIIPMLQTSKALSSDVLRRLALVSKTPEQIDQLLEQKNLSDDVFAALLSKTILTESQQLFIINATKSRNIFNLIINLKNTSTKVQDTILQDLRIDNLAIRELLKVNTYSNIQLLTILGYGYIMDKNILQEVLVQKNLDEQGLVEIIKNSYTDSSILELVFSHPAANAGIRKQVLNHPKLSNREIVRIVLNNNKLSDEELVLILNIPASCDTEVHVAILNISNLQEHHLRAIITDCQKAELLEQIYNHPSASPTIRTEVLQHRLLTGTIILNILQNQISNTQLLTILGHHVVGNIVIQNVLKQKNLDEQGLLKIIKHSATESYNLERVFSHPAANAELRQQVLTHQKCSARTTEQIVLNNKLSDEELSLTLNNPSICDTEVYAALLKKSYLKEHHLRTIIKGCQKADLLEQIYNHSSASSTVREEVLQHRLLTPTIILSILQNKNSNPHLLTILGHHAVDRAVIESVLEQQNLDEQILLKIIKHSTTDSNNLERVFSHPAANAELRQHVLRHQKCSARTIEQIVLKNKLSDEELSLILNNPSVYNTEVHEAILKSSNLEEHHLKAMIKGCQKADQLEQIYNHPSASSTVHEEVLQHRLLTPTIILNILQNKNSNTQLLTILGHHAVDRAVIQGVLAQTNLDEQGLIKIIKHSATDSSNLERVFSHPSANAELHKQVLKHQALSARSLKQIISNNDLSDEEFLLLISNPDVTNYSLGIIDAILAKSTLSKTVLLTLINRFNQDKGILTKIYTHHSFDEKACHELLQSPNLTPYMMLPLIANKSLSGTDLLVILNNPSACNTEVHEAILQSPILKDHHFSAVIKNCQKADLLELIYNHPSASPIVCQEVLQHRLLTPTIILNILQHKNSNTQLLTILGHHAVDRAVIQHVLDQQNLDEQGLLKIIQHSATDSNNLERVFSHPTANTELRKQVLTHRALSAKTLQQIISNNELSDEELLLLINNPDITIDISFFIYFILIKNTLSKPVLLALINRFNEDRDILTAIYSHKSFDEQVCHELLQLPNVTACMMLPLVTNKFIPDNDLLVILNNPSVCTTEVLMAILEVSKLKEHHLRAMIKICQNADLLELIYNHPSASSTVYDEVLQHRLLTSTIILDILKNKNSNTQLLTILGHDAVDRTIIQRVLEQQNLDEQGLLEISKHSAADNYILRLVYSHPAANAEIRKQVLKHKALSAVTIEQIVYNNELSDEELLLLINNPDITNYGSGIIDAILAKSTLSKTVLLALINRFNQDRSILTQIYTHHHSFDEDVCHELLQSPNLAPYMMLPLIANKSLSGTDLLLILNNPSACNTEVHEAILKESNLEDHHFSAIIKNCQKADLLEQIYNHPYASSTVCQEVLQHRLLTPKIILNILQNKNLNSGELSLILRHPTACNETICHTLLNECQLKEEHLLEILAKYESENIVERIYNHPAAHSRVREHMLHNPSVPLYILMDILNNQALTDNELMLILRNPLVQNTPFLYQKLNRFHLSEDHFNEIMNHYENNGTMSFIYNHPSASQELRKQVLMHPELPVRNFLRENTLFDNDLLILLKNPVLDNTDLEVISKMPFFGYDVLVALITHDKANVYSLFSATNHRTFNLNAAYTILRRNDEIPQYLLLRLASKTLDFNDNSPLWEHCIERIIQMARKQNDSTELNRLFEEHVSWISTSLSLKLLAFLGKKVVDRAPMTSIIQKATKTDFDALIALPKNYSREELTALAKKDLNSEQIDNLLAHKAMTSIVAEVLFKKPAYSGTIKTWDWLSEAQLLNTIDKTKDYNSLTLALRHGSILSESALSEFMETKREQHREHLKYGQVSTKIEIKLLCTLEDLRLKSLSHAIKAVKDPSYEQVAKTSFDLYQTLHKEVEKFVVNPKANAAVFNKNCKKAIKDAEPVLQDHRGYKQFFVDFINVVFAITALFRNGNWRLFEAKTDSMNKVNNVLHTMDQLIADSNNIIAPSAA
jgi:hypothetical protein